MLLRKAYNNLIRLMKDGSRACYLNLLSYQQINGITYYDIQINFHGQKYLWRDRYSQLKQVSKQFPQTTSKFPPKNSLSQVISQITNSKLFLVQRFALMKQYFESVSSCSELRFNKAFLKIYRHLQQKNQPIKQTSCIQKAPKLKGKKLSMKQFESNEIYIII